MQIQLRQNEIVAALKQYITQQGINLKGKEVKIVFTAGRKEGGLTADLSIEDIDIPGFNGNGDHVETQVTESPQEPDKPKLETKAPADETPAPGLLAAPAEEVSDATPVVKTTSLFS